MSEQSERGFTIEYLNECFSVENSTLIWKDRPSHHFIKGEWSRKVFKSNFSGKPAGKVNQGYLQTKINGVTCQNHRILFLLQNGFISGVIDHIDGDTLNNSIDNLRSVEIFQNSMNCKTPVNNTSGCKGVYFHKSIGKFTASIRINGRLAHLGTFVDFDDAMVARKNAEKKYYGEYANER